ncbi:hypothetical protein O3M35_012503 [Rhynocoris fuscipes]|uniref:Uncharacterized protein n=1 Tax=Rhynocoris fuscipes TaxID=488301 RepID=A0AAW1CZ19_9HEMI
MNWIKGYSVQSNDSQGLQSETEGQSWKEIDPANASDLVTSFNSSFITFVILWLSSLLQVQVWLRWKSGSALQAQDSFECSGSEQDENEEIQDEDEIEILESDESMQARD